MWRDWRPLVAARKWLTLLFFEVFRKRRAAASATLVGGGICHAGDTHKKARAMAGKGNSVEAL
jgi:hypothetical protein